MQCCVFYAAYNVLMLFTVIAPMAAELAPMIPFCRKHFGFKSIQIIGENDSSWSSCVLFGGAGDNYLRYDITGHDYLNDLWHLNISDYGFQWTQINDGDMNAPSGRWKFNMIDFNESLSVIVYGGDNPVSDNTEDMWSFDFMESASNVSGSWQIVKKYDSNNAGPGQRRSAGAATTTGNELFVTNGRLSDSPQDCDSQTFSIDLNNLNNSTWVTKAALPSTCRSGLSFTRVMAYSNGTAEEAMVAFGGRYIASGDSSIYYSELWLYNITADTWSQIEQSDHKGDGNIPSARDHHGAVYIEALNSLFIHGGRDSTDMVGFMHRSNRHITYIQQHKNQSYVLLGNDMQTQKFEQLFKVAPLDDLWSFNFKTMKWTLLDKPLLTKPAARFAHGLTYIGDTRHTNSLKLVLFGGEVIHNSGYHTLLNDIWLYSIEEGIWTQVSSSDCSEGATGAILEPVVSVSSLFFISQLMILISFSFIICYIFKPWDRVHRYMAIQPSA